MKLAKYEYRQARKAGKASLKSFLGDGIVSLLMVVMFILAVAAALGLGRQVNASHQAIATRPGCQVSQHYPDQILQWCDLITSYAQASNLSPNLVAALIWYESRGNETAYSRDGAVGLMQIMPRDGKAATFLCEDKPCFMNRPTRMELDDPEFNIRYGTRLLNGLIDAYQGDVREALKNYGPVGVDYAYADAVLHIYSDYAAR